MTKRGKITIIISICLLSVVLALSLTALTYAVWQTTATANEELDVPIDDYNPSEKYIVFRGIDNNGDFSNSPTEYAVVGYTGLVSELIIPEEHNDLPVTKIYVDSTTSPTNYYATRLSGNGVVTSIVIPASVTFIANGACKDMMLLNSVTILGETSSSLVIGELAFANCPNLSTFTVAAGRIDTANSSTNYTLGCPNL